MPAPGSAAAYVVGGLWLLAAAQPVPVPEFEHCVLASGRGGAVLHHTPRDFM